MAKPVYNNDNSGVVFINVEKQEELAKRDAGQAYNEKAEKWPDRKGSGNLNGEEFWISGWVKESSRDGSKFMSLAFKPKEARETPRSKPEYRSEPNKTKIPEDDEIPF